MVIPAVRTQPRLSASQLADYLVAPTPVGQEGILRQAKNPSQAKPLIIQYQHAKRCVATCLREPGRVNSHVAETTILLRQRATDTTSGPLVRDDALRSIDVVEQFQRIANVLDLEDMRFESAPGQNQPLSIEGVEIASWPDAVAYQTPRRGDVRVGELFIRCTLGTTGDAAQERRSEANRFLATIAHMHAVQTLGHLGAVSSSASMVLDVPRESIVRGPANASRRVANIEAACRMIAARWASI